MGRINSRAKGKRGELEFRDLLRKNGVNARRGQQYAGTSDGGAPDVIHDLPGVHFEVKWVEKLNLAEAMAQAKNDCGGQIPVVAHKRNRGEWYVTLPAEAFLGLVVKPCNDDKYEDL